MEQFKLVFSRPNKLFYQQYLTFDEFNQITEGMVGTQACFNKYQLQGTDFVDQYKLLADLGIE